jgi:DNA-binding NtrC family response regulator
MNAIQLVVCDMHMPYMDGRKTVQVLKKLKPEIKIIVVSGNPNLDRTEQLTAEYSASILVKPYTVQILLNAVHSSLSLG